MINNRLSQIYIVAVLLTVIGISSAIKFSESRYYSPLVRNTYSNICPKPEFQNGMIRIKLRGKFLQFDCNRNFTRVGSKYLLCTNGRWNSPAPICVKPGCSALSVVDNGFIFYENDKAAATLFCDSGFKIVGPMYSYCNGTDWDRTIGSCRSGGLTDGRSCDFETDDLCGWENEAIGSVVWERSSGIVSRKLMKTGPKHDHTTGEPLNGHFLMVDSSQHNTNATAHLISPVYGSNYSSNACFRFFYHMFGDVGKLSVYVKPLSVNLDVVLQQPAQFSVSGNQGNSWNEAYFDLPIQNGSFQIVIQAMLGMRYKSDTAIDDVALLNGLDCQSNGTVQIPQTENETDLFKIDSCVNRCDSLMNSFEGNDSNIVHCGCTIDCGTDNNICCPDYAEVCLFGDSNGTEDDMVTMTVNRSTEWNEDVNSYNREEITSGVISSSDENVSSTIMTIGILGAFSIIFVIVFTIKFYRADCGVNFISWLKQRSATDTDGNCMKSSDEVKYLAVNDEINSISEECQSLDSMHL